jgi:hypothetical protein
MCWHIALIVVSKVRAMCDFEKEILFATKLTGKQGTEHSE